MRRSPLSGSGFTPEQIACLDYRYSDDFAFDAMCLGVDVHPTDRAAAMRPSDRRRYLAEWDRLSAADCCWDPGVHESELGSFLGRARIRRNLRRYRRALRESDPFGRSDRRSYRRRRAP